MAHNSGQRDNSAQDHQSLKADGADDPFEHIAAQRLDFDLKSRFNLSHVVS